MGINLDRLRAFIVVARTENLTVAARELGVSQSNLGRQMTALEKEVGLTIFVRHSRGLALTKQGEEFLALCHDIVDRLQGTDIIREKDTDPSGCLKIISESGMLGGILEKLPRFSEKFPNINFSFSSATDAHQLQIGHSEVALMTQPLNNDPNYIQLPLYDMILRVYASPAYIKLHGIPKEIEDLKSHRIIIYVGENSEQFNSYLPNEFIKNPRYFIVITNRSSMSMALVSGSGA